MTPAPWADPELIARGPPADARGPARRTACRSTARWRFQLLHRPDESPGDAWGEADVPGCWTMQDTWDKPHYTNVQMPFPQRPPATPEENPTGVYERSFELPGGVGRAPGRAPRGGRGERAARRAQRARGRRSARTRTWPPSSTSPTALRPGVERPPADGGQVVRRLVHRGPGPVVARRHHAAGVPVRDRPDVPRGPRGRRRASTPTASTGTLALEVRVGWPADPPGGGLAGRGDASRASPSRCARPSRSAPPPRRAPGRLGRAGPAAPRRARPVSPQRRGRADRPPTTVERWQQAEPRVRPAADRPVRSWRPGSRASRRGRPRCPALVRLHGVARSRPTGRVVERVERRIGFRRVEVRRRSSCWSTGGRS